jgi:2-polyprenyl-3-methyl-5-hydroxy-6-metoxy-1,4-benzoquinol methylase
VHGEATFVDTLDPRPASVLDAGCGTGRVAIELARRGIDVVGVDLDSSMLAVARRKQPDLPWVEADLATLALGRVFDVVVAAGNVMIFLAPGSERTVLERLAAHVAPDGGRLVTGFQLTPDHYGLADYDRDTAAAGLVLVERFATWDRDPWPTGGARADYAVSVHRTATG